MSKYDGMLPDVPVDGRLGFYPVTNKREWDELPDLYKVMEWESVADPFDKGKRLRAIKSVIFDVVYMEPYGIRAEVAVHPENVQKILYCSYGLDTQCHLYSIKGIELEGGTRLRAMWEQDDITGAFAIKVAGRYVARQGGFDGYVPERVYLDDKGAYKFDFGKLDGKTAFYEFANPFDGRFGKAPEAEKVDPMREACAASRDIAQRDAEEPEKGRGAR